MKREKIAIYCASSPELDAVYKSAAYNLGSELARKGCDIVCGGGRDGLMKQAIEGALEAGGEAFGVIPGFMVDRAWNHPALTQTIVTDTMHERKQTMASLSAAVIALPGGCGTLDELFEIITWRQLGLYEGNVVILNIDHYYDPLFEMFDRMFKQHFMNPDHRELFAVAETVEQAVELATKPAVHREFSQKLK